MPWVADIQEPSSCTMHMGRPNGGRSQGQLANATLATLLPQQDPLRFDNLAIELDERTTAGELQARLAPQDPDRAQCSINEDAIEGLKFNQCLPMVAAHKELGMRMADTVAVRETLRHPIREISAI